MRLRDSLSSSLSLIVSLTVGSTTEAEKQLAQFGRMLFGGGTHTVLAPLAFTSG